MNQVTNLIQWKNLTEDQRKEFNFKDYQYVSQHGEMWMHCAFESSYEGRPGTVYQLVIEEDKWYVVEETSVVAGNTIALCAKYDGIRPAREDEIPKDEPKLEEEVKEEFPNCEYVELDWHGTDWCIVRGGIRVHTSAQSMKGFFTYVYENERGWFTRNSPTCSNGTGFNALLPVGALFVEG